MEIWLIVGGKRSGPYPDYEIRSRIEHGQLDQDEKVWHDGLADWTRVGDLELFRNSFEKIEKTEVVASIPDFESKEEVKPEKPKSYFMRRFWARWTDLNAYFALIWLGMYFLAGDIRTAIANPWFLIGSLLPWVIFEAWCLQKFGTTPGKWLLGLRVSQENHSLLTFNQSISRSLRVMSTGVGLCWGLLAILCQVLSLFLTLKMGRPLWDHLGKHQVTSKPMKAYRIALLVMTFLLSIQLQVAVRGPYESEIIQGNPELLKTFPQLKEMLKENQRWYFPKNETGN